MRKIVVVIVALACLASGSASANILYNDGFEEGDLGQFSSVDIPGWVAYGSSGWHHEDGGAHFDAKAIKEWSDDTGIFQDFDVIVGMEYDFSVYAISLDSDAGGLHGWDAVFKVEWLDSDYVLIRADEIGRYYGIKDAGSSGQAGDPLNTWKFLSGTKTAPYPAAVGRVVLHLTDGDSGYTAKSGSINWDNVTVAVPYSAENPTPPNYANNLVPSEVTALYWDRPEPRQAGNTVLCDVWFGIDPNVPGNNTLILDHQDADSVSIGPLDSDQDYYWRVDCYDPNGMTYIKTQGVVWTFNTGNIAPVADAGDKQKVWLESGAASVSLDGTASDDGQPDPPGQLSYTWTVIDGPANVVYTPSNQVEDPTVMFTTAGDYVFELFVSDGLADANDVVTVQVYPEGYTGLIAHWTLDETSGTTAADSIGGHDGTLVGDAAWTSEGKVNGAILLDGDGDYINCGGGTDANTLSWADLTEEMTVAAWMKGTFDKSWQAIVNKGDSSWRLFRDCVNGDSDNASFTCSNIGAVASGNTGSVNDNKWHQVVGTYDGVYLSIYVDGLLAVSQRHDQGTIAVNDYNVFIGGDDQFPGQRDFTGLIDEVRIYEIGLSADQVLDLFIADGGQNSCGLDTIVGDVNGDCYVDISDLSDMAANWLQCNDIANATCQ